MPIYDQAGNAIPDNAAIPTATPGIVKSPYHEGDPVPNGSAVRSDASGTWIYYPTEQALRMGKIIAAWDTITALPDQVSQTLEAAGVNVRAISERLPFFIVGGVLLYILARGK